MNEAEAKRLWLEAVERVKDVTLAPTLWQALEVGHGIDREGNTFIIGFSSTDGPEGSYLRSSEHRPIIEKVISTLFGEPMEIRIIEGTSQAEFVLYKQREVIAEQTRRKAQDRKRVERAAEAAWEQIAEQCSRAYAKTPMRQMPQIRATFFATALEMVSDAMDRIHPDGQIDEIGNRALARVLEKLATITDMPSVIVGIELWRYRENRPKKQPVEHAEQPKAAEPKKETQPQS